MGWGHIYAGKLEKTNFIGYNGKVFDPVSQTYNYGFREYSTSRKQWLTTDPIRDGINWKAYSGGAADPVNYTDLWGLCKKEPKELFHNWYNTSIKLHNIAVAEELVFRKALMNLDPIDFADKYQDFGRGANDILGPDYRAAYERAEHFGSLLGYADKVMNWVEDRGVKGSQPTDAEITAKAEEVLQSYQMFNTYFAPVIYGSIGFAQMPGSSTLVRKAIDKVKEGIGKVTGKLKTGAPAEQPGSTPNVVDNGLNNPAAGAEGGDFVNLASEQRTQHILYGDQTGGGHMWPGQPGKTLFPKNWSAEKIMNEVSDIATEPNLTWTRPDGKTGMFYNSGKPARFSVIGESEGIKIKVVIEPAGEGIITAHPID